MLSRLVELGWLVGWVGMVGWSGCLVGLGWVDWLVGWLVGWVGMVGFLGWLG